MTAGTGVTVFWFRRDLRLEDNTGLIHALQDVHPVLPVFIFDRNILERLNDRSDRRVQFIHQETVRLRKELEDKHGTSLCVLDGRSDEIIEQLLREFPVKAVYANEDYEPYARARDQQIKEILHKAGIRLHLFKDQVIRAKDDILKGDGKPYTVFTPYSKRWLDKMSSHAPGQMNHELPPNFWKADFAPVPSLSDLGFFPDETTAFPSRTLEEDVLKNYAATRDIPSADATSHLGVHLRFGTISIRRLVQEAQRQSPVFLNELIWREFFQQVIWHFPYIVDRCFKSQYERLEWRNDESEFQAWCEGKTGYPLVDAGMRELNVTGFMHNRVRMVTASFLTKHLLVDWRLGEAYFAEKLLDYELASNNGNWQWAAGTGCDAAPYFRIFNPMEQARKFDPDGLYIRKWVPEIDKTEYPSPIVDHKEARERALRTYKKCLGLSV